MFNNSTIVIIIVIAFAFYLIYSHNNQQKIIHMQAPQKPQTFQSPCPPCKKCEHDKHHPQIPQPPPITNVTVDTDNDAYSDPIKKQDTYTMYDPLTYPQYRLPRDVLQKYNEYYERNGAYPPFGQATQPLFDNPTLNGYLIKECEENEPFNDNVPGTVPLFRVASSKNTNRYFYYILDQRYFSKVELKIPLDHVKLNGIRHNNAEFYGLPEIFDGDIIEHIPIYPLTRFRVVLYKTYSFP